MWVSKKKWEELNDRVAALEKEPSIKMFTKDYRETLTTEWIGALEFEWVWVPKTGEAKVVSLRSVLEVLADAVGVELYLEPSKPETPTKPVAKKKARKKK